MPSHLRLGVNIDHVATIRNARGGDHPDPVRAAFAAAEAGADGITAHLREDRRHIRDEDIARLMDAGIRVSLFIAPDERQLEAALQLGAPVVEFHTGEYAHAEGEQVAVEVRKIADLAALAVKNGIEPHAGHGLTYDNVQPIAAIPQLAELNIGHYLVGEAVFVGLAEAVRQMRDLMDAAR